MSTNWTTPEGLQSSWFIYTLDAYTYMTPTRLTPGSPNAVKK
jgi:hypothetical protein